MFYGRRSSRCSSPRTPRFLWLTEKLFLLVNGVLGRLRLRLVTSRGPPYPSRSPRAHPSGWTRTQGLSHRDSHAPPSFGTTPVRMWNWPLAPLLRRAGNQVVREMPSHTRPSNPEAGSESCLLVCYRPLANANSAV